MRFNVQICNSIILHSIDILTIEVPNLVLSFDDSLYLRSDLIFSDVHLLANGN